MWVIIHLKKFPVTLLLVGLMSLFLTRTVSADWESSWRKPVSMGSYEDIYIFSLDLRDLKFQVYDEDVRKFVDAKFPAQTLEEIANDLYFRIQNRLQGILPINAAQQIDPAKNSLVIELKLSALFRYEDHGKIMQMLAGKPRSSVPISVEGSLKDSKTRDVLLTFKDTQPFEWEESDVPIGGGNEQQSRILEILDFWARQLAADLAKQKLQS